MRTIIRQTQRVPRKAVDIEATLYAGRDTEHVTLQNLSMHGAGLVTGLSMAVGTEVRVRFKVPCHGTCVWVEAFADVRHAEGPRGAQSNSRQATRGKKSRTGLRFLRLSYEAQRALSVFLQGVTLN